MRGSGQAWSGRPAGDAGREAYAVPGCVQPGVRPSNAPQWLERSRRSLVARFPVSRLELGALDSAVPSARLHARLVLREWGFDREFTDVVELLVSELVTNAVWASRALEPRLPSSVHLWLRADRTRVTVVVWDGNPQPPVPKTNVPYDAEDGRGLLLVQALSERWGWTATPHAGGKSVWCVVAREAMR